MGRISVQGRPRSWIVYPWKVTVRFCICTCFGSYAMGQRVGHYVVLIVILVGMSWAAIVQLICMCGSES